MRRRGSATNSRGRRVGRGGGDPSRPLVTLRATFSIAGAVRAGRGLFGRRGAHQGVMAHEATALTDCDLRAHDAERPDLDAGVDDCIGMDDARGVDGDSLGFAGRRGRRQRRPGADVGWERPGYAPAAH